MNTRPTSLLCSLLFTFFLCITITSPLFARCIQGDCQNGSGTFLFPGGSKYIGEWENGQMCGEGTFIFSSGAKYCGKWEEGNLIHYTDLETAQKTKTALDAKQIEAEKQNIETEKRLFDTKFDPSFELPETAAGFPSKK